MSFEIFEFCFIIAVKLFECKHGWKCSQFTNPSKYIILIDLSNKKKKTYYIPALEIIWISPFWFWILQNSISFCLLYFHENTKFIKWHNIRSSCSFFYHLFSLNCFPWNCDFVRFDWFVHNLIGHTFDCILFNL